MFNHAKVLIPFLSAGVQSARIAQQRLHGVAVHKYDAEAEDFIVLFKEGVSQSTIQEVCDGHCTFEGGSWASVQGFADLERVVHGHQNDIELLETDTLDKLIPDIPVEAGVQAAESWGLDAIELSSAQSTGKGVHIYIQDTGMRHTHTDFGGRGSAALDMTSGKAVECSPGSAGCAKDQHGHGTHCGGTAAGTTYGVAKGAQVYAVKTLNPWGGSRSWQLAAHEWLMAKGSKPMVISMSLGGSGVDQSYTRTIGAATKAGIVVVVAAGNSNADSCRFSPAFATNAITVGATDSAMSRASYSNYGTCNNIMAPGSAITSSWKESNKDSKTISGTSMACPHVSGAVALLLEENGALGRSGVMEKLTRAGARGAINGLKSGDPDVFLQVKGF